MKDIFNDTFFGFISKIFLLALYISFTGMMGYATVKITMDTGEIPGAGIILTLLLLYPTINLVYDIVDYMKYDL